jgi:hypothetical protein
MYFKNSQKLPFGNKEAAFKMNFLNAVVYAVKWPETELTKCAN